VGAVVFLSNVPVEVHTTLHCAANGVNVFVT